MKRIGPSSINRGMPRTEFGGPSTSVLIPFAIFTMTRTAWQPAVLPNKDQVKNTDDVTSTPPPLRVATSNMGCDCPERTHPPVLDLIGSTLRSAFASTVPALDCIQ